MNETYKPDFKTADNVFNEFRKTNGEKKMNKIRLQITLHPEEIKRLDEIKKKRKYSRSGMMGILIREYKD